ncbi:hypothetical protein L1987_52894 [Smallanthus sonchifolius]|uniref:Uncharacterized protein n=1 Tax=Smallanthus sonchifolius TaxID=185202 RepID=A0ACB9EU31_9ASTR|nr:hypothetical protein L1987_52894 [Smallanthus sonchifolius]
MRISNEYADNLLNMFPNENYDGHSNEQYLLEQASMYQSFEARNHNNYIAGFEHGIVDERVNVILRGVMMPRNRHKLQARTQGKLSLMTGKVRNQKNYPKQLALKTKAYQSPALRSYQLPSTSRDCSQKKEMCLVCQMKFKSGDRLIILACSHRYHSKCITDLLKLKKNCPICQKEVV